MTRTVTDAALMYQVMAGFHPADPFSIPGSDDVMSEMKQGIRGLKIAYSPNLGLWELDPKVRHACDKAVRYLKIWAVRWSKSTLGLRGHYRN